MCADFIQVPKRTKTTLKRKSLRQNVKRHWYQNEDVYIVRCELKNKESGLFETESIRSFTKDGSIGYQYSKAKPIKDGAIDAFCADHGYENVLKCDEHSTPKRDQVYQWTCFSVGDVEYVQSGTGMYVECTFYNNALDTEIVFRGGEGLTGRIAKKRFYNAFNNAYPGCTLEEDEDITDGDE